MRGQRRRQRTWALGQPCEKTARLEGTKGFLHLSDTSRPDDN